MSNLTLMQSLQEMAFFVKYQKWSVTCSCSSFNFNGVLSSLTFTKNVVTKGLFPRHNWPWQLVIKMLPDNYPDQMTPLILEALVGLYAKKWLENNGTLALSTIHRGKFSSWRATKTTKLLTIAVKEDDRNDSKWDLFQHCNKAEKQF